MTLQVVGPVQQCHGTDGTTREGWCVVALAERFPFLHLYVGNRRILEERYNLEDALVVATFLNSFINHAHVVKMANMAQLVNVIAPMFTNEKSMFLQTIYYPLALFANNAKGTALDLHVESPKYESRRFGDVRYLDTSAAYDHATLVLNLVNRHRDQPIEAEFVLQDKSFAGPDVKAENDFGTTKIQTATRTTSASGQTLRYTVPPRSYTMLKCRVS